MREHEAVEVRVNGEPRAVPFGLSLRDLLVHLELRPELIVVELNGEIIPRDHYPRVPIEAGDALELVHFVGGGNNDGSRSRA